MIIIARYKNDKPKNGYEYARGENKKIKLFESVKHAVKFLNDYATQQTGMRCKMTETDYHDIGFKFIDEKDASPKAQKLIFEARF